MSDQLESEVWHVTVEHTDTLTGAPDIAKVQVPASSEEEAIERAKMKHSWPEPEYYDEDDMGARQV